MAKKKLKVINEIYGYGWTFDMVNNFMKNLSQDDTAIIPVNSYGGQVMEGLAIHNVIKGSKAKTEAHIVGYAMSMGTIIALAADEVVMPENGYFMIHEPSKLTWGDSDTHEHAANFLENVADDLCDIYVKRTGKDKVEVRNMMKKETWLTAQQALEMGFVDRLSKGSEIHASAIDLSDYKNVPDNIIGGIENKGTQENHEGILKQCVQVLNQVKSYFMSDTKTVENEGKDTLTLESLAEQVNNLSTEVSTIKSENLTLSSENADLKTQIEAKDQEIAELKSQPGADHTEVDNEEEGEEEVPLYMQNPINKKARSLRS